MGQIFITFDIHTPVAIQAIEAEGHVREIAVTAQGILYKVAYWNDCKLEEAWLPAYELSKPESKE